LSALARRLGVALAAVLLAAACDPGTGPRDNRPPGRPPAGSTTINPNAYDVHFVVEVTGPAPAYTPHNRQVTMTVAAIQQDGQFAIGVDPTTGQQARGPVQVIRTTPVRWGMTLGAGVVTGSVTAVYLGQAGDRLSCHVERAGLELPGSRDERRIEYTPTAHGSAEVYCFHTPPTAG